MRAKVKIRRKRELSGLRAAAATRTEEISAFLRAESPFNGGGGSTWRLRLAPSAVLLFLLRGLVASRCIANRENTRRFRTARFNVLVPGGGGIRRVMSIRARAFVSAKSVVSLNSR